jgi:hypothetical protein
VIKEGDAGVDLHHATAIQVEAEGDVSFGGFPVPFLASIVHARSGLGFATRFHVADDGFVLVSRRPDNAEKISGMQLVLA